MGSAAAAVSYHAARNESVSIEDHNTELLDEFPDDQPATTRGQPKLTYFDAFALLVSLQIGAGIFSSPSSVDKHTPAPGFAIVIWLISGLLAWTGAACYAELGAALPVSGGTQEYLKYIFGDGLAFMVSWIWIMAVKPSGMAALSITFAQYWINYIFDSSVASANGWQSKLLAITGFTVVNLLNMLSIDATMKMTRFFLVVKLSTLLLLFSCTIASLCFGINYGEAPSSDWYDRNWFSITNTTWPSGILDNIGQYTVAIYAGLWAYSGWDNVNMVAGDMDDTGRDLPRAIHSAQPVVICSFVLANVCYYLMVSWSEVSATNTIAVTVGHNVLSWVGSLSFAILVSLACLGSVNVNVFTTSRLVVSAAQADWFPRFFEKLDSIHRRRSGSDSSKQASRTPIRAMLFSFCITVIYIILGTFGSLITFIGLAEYIFFGATAIGLIVLRVREPALRRPYKPNIIIPVVFGAISLFLVVFGGIQAPIQASVLAFLLLSGLARKYDVGGIIWRHTYTKMIGKSRYEPLSQA